MVTGGTIPYIINGHPDNSYAKTIKIILEGKTTSPHRRMTTKKPILERV
jgi:hypothetical protein